MTAPLLAQLAPAGEPASRPDAADAPGHARMELNRSHNLAELQDGDGPRHERWEKAAYLGVATWPAQAALRQQVGLPRGVGLVVDFIEPQSPADAAGLRQYDVIHKLDDQVLINPQQLAVLVRVRHAGETVKLAVVRDGKPLTLDVKLVEKEAPPLEELRLGAAEPPEPGAILPGGNDWPGLPNLPGRRIGPAALTMPQPDGAYRVFWNDGSAELAVSNQGARRFLVFRDKAGQVLFRGPIDTAEQREEIPKDVREQLSSLPAPFKLEAEPATRPADNGKAPPTQPASRKIEPADRLRITIADLTGPGTSTVTEMSLDKSGNVRLPYLNDPLHAVGMTEAELESSIVEAYRFGPIIPWRQVSVEIIREGK